jgi:hypothetical protein
MAVSSVGAPTPTRTSTPTRTPTITSTVTSTLTPTGTPTLGIVPNTYLPLVIGDRFISPPPTATPGVTAGSIPSFRHIFVIVLENHEYTSVISNTAAPYFNQLAQQYGLATNYYAIRHPSLPNYLALTGGDTFGISSDCTRCFINAPSLADQIEAAGKTWKAYMEGMPRPCFVGDSGLYAQKHNPFIYYDAIRNDATRCAKIVPFSQFSADLQVNAVPDYSWLTPNLCNDEHDCGVDKGDAWLSTWVPRILASPTWQQDGVLFIVYDEGTTDTGCCGVAAGGRIAMLVISPLGRPSFRSNLAYTHYSMLRTIEAAWQLPLLGQANCDCALPMADFFTAPNATQP